MKTKKTNVKFADNHGHNTLRLFDMLAKILLTTNEEKGYYS